MTLLQCSLFSGISYRNTAVNWASFLRELFKEHFFLHTRHRVLSGEIEIDESMFRRKMKYHRGDPPPGLRVWIFGMVERQSNTVILYRVGDHTKQTLIPLIKRHVAPGSTIYSNGWGAYCDFHSNGYKNFPYSTSTVSKKSTLTRLCTKEPCVKRTRWKELRSMPRSTSRECREHSSLSLRDTW